MRAKLLLAILILAGLDSNAQQKGYYRTPAIYQNIVLFTAEGDLWKFDLSNGVTSRLTTDQGMETFPVISPDGKQVVFSGQYEGISELYLMNLNGSVPKRLTYLFDRSIHASGWTSDGKILYRTSTFSGLPSQQLYTLDPVSLINEPVPLSEASFGCYDGQGNLFFTRLPNQGSKTKRYKGGTAEQIWVFNGKQEARNITEDFEGTSTNPMYYNERIYFLSDRDGTMNIWSMDKEGKNLKQHSFSKGWDIQFPSIQDSKIVYQKGADIYLYDIRANTEKLLDINLNSDFNQRKPKWIKSPVGSITYSDISPKGNYAAIISRGRLFVSPVKSDRWVEVTRKSGIRFREAHFIDEKNLAVLSDQGGEYEIWKMSADGSGEPVQITKNNTTLITSFAISPDGKYIAYNNKNEVLRITEISTGQQKFEYKDSYGGTDQILWSPNSRFMSFIRGLENQNQQICVVDVHEMKIIPVTTERLNSYSPSWTKDGKWLYFTSERNLQTKVNSPWGARQPEPYYTKTNNIYAIPLDSTEKFPFLQQDSWLTDSVYNPSPVKDTSEKNNQKQSGKSSPGVAANYNWIKASATLYVLPVKSTDVNGLELADGFVYWLEGGNPDEAKGSKLFALKIGESKKYEPTEIASAVDGFGLSADKKKLLISFTNKTLAIADANGQKVDVDKSKLELSNWNFVVNPQDDWKEMYADAWRMMRDFFYDRDLHKVDWPEVKKRYEPLLERITDRDELDDLLSQMVGELSALHTFVVGGDKRVSPDQIPIGFLGATFKKTDAGLQIKHIYQSDPDYPEISSPLNKPELKIKEGDIITAVNNVPIQDVQNVAELLANKVGIPVKLNIRDAHMKVFEQVVKPISSRDNFLLRYGEWELECRWKVDKASNNDIGYVHLKALSGRDMDDFVKQFYPVFNRKGLILDVRHNGGGNIDSWVLEKLLRKAWMYWQGRNGGPYWNMPFAFRGHMVILCDQFSGSDGEAICEGFRRLGMGKVIGVRTWGGEIWLSFDNTLVDNGIASAAEFGVYGPEGKWLIEGHGVEPDIKVDNLPFETYKGKDAQLEFAIDYLNKEIKKDPRDVPQAPLHPDKSFKY